MPSYANSFKLIAGSFSLTPPSQQLEQFLKLLYITCPIAEAAADLSIRQELIYSSFRATAVLHAGCMLTDKPEG